MNKDNIPTIEPTWGTAIEFNKENCITKIDLDWNDFYKMNREKQIDELGFILQSLKEIPGTRKMARKTTKRIEQIEKSATIDRDRLIEWVRYWQGYRYPGMLENADDDEKIEASEQIVARLRAFDKLKEGIEKLCDRLSSGVDE